MDNYSLSDIRAVTEGEGFGNGGAWWIIILFLFMLGRGGIGNDALTRADMQSGFDTNEITRKLDGITNGLSDGFYAQNTTMLNGFAGVTSAVRDAQFAAQQCCCETNRNIDATRCDITTAIHAEGEATRALIRENEIQTLRDKVTSLEMDSRFCGIPRVSPYGYNMVPAAYGCGCGYTNI